MADESSEHNLEHLPKRRTRPEALKKYEWKPGQSGNPGGRPKRDLAADIAVQIFEKAPDEIFEAMRKAVLKGDARVFQVLADRGFGKLKEQVEHSGDLKVGLVERLQNGRKRVKAKEETESTEP